MAKALATDKPSPPPRRRRTPGIGPAFAVVAIAATILVLYGVGAALTGGHRTPTPPARHVAKVGSLHAAPAAAALRPIEDPSEPPADVLHALVVPRHAHAIGKTPWKEVTQYSAQMRFDVAASQGALVRFYKKELKARGWSITNVGSARGHPRATEVLAQRTSTDGWYWAVGVVVMPTTFSSSSPSDTTPFTVEIYQEIDPT